MIPGSPQILTCPYCGKEKQIMTVVSGNTFGAKLWSDLKWEAPMLPDVSLVQKCPHCGKYFMRNRQEVRYAADEDYSLEKGTLTYPETKEALLQISNEGFIDVQEELAVRKMFHRAFNDYYYRSRTNITIEDAENAFFVANAKWIINNLSSSDDDNVLKAELYREIGEFEKANSLIMNISGKDELLKYVVSKILSKIQDKDSRVFRIM